MGDRKEKEVKAEGWPAKVGGTHHEEPRVSPSLPAGGCHSLVPILPHLKLLHLEQPGQAPLRLPGRAWRWGP